MSAFRMSASLSNLSPFIDLRPDLPSIPKPAQQRAGVKAGERVPDHVLEASVLDGSDLHDSLRDLAHRYPDEDRLRALMDRSEAKEADPVRWRKRYNEIPRLVKSAIKKHAKRMEQAFGNVSPEPPQPTPGVGPNAPAPGPPLPVLPVLTVGELKRMKLKPRRWIIEHLIPEGEPTLIYGPGAAGKSLALFQLAVCIATGRPFLGRDVPTGRVLFYTCEDGADEIKRRGEDILKSVGVTWDDLAERLRIIPMRESEHDAMLVDEKLGPTATYEALKLEISAFKPDVVMMDTLADVFGGDENRRTDAKRFVKQVIKLAPRATHILAAHPSVSGIESGRGYSGSTGWPGAVRSHLSFERFEKGKFEGDKDVRKLFNKKVNYGQEGAGEILMRWKEGAFVPIDDTVAETPEADVDALFLALLAKFGRSNRNVTESRAATTFAKEPEAKRAGVGKKDFEAAIGRLFDARRLTNEEYKGSNGAPARRLAILDPDGPTPWKST